MKVFAIVTLIVVMGAWALALSLMVFYREKSSDETHDQEAGMPTPLNHDQVTVDGLEIDLSGDDDDVIFEHI